MIHIDTRKYTYELPDERIAKYPLERRDMSKLLVYNGNIEQSTFANIGSYLPKDCMLVFNNTRVIHARLKMQKATGAVIEVFCLEPITPSDVQASFAQTGKCMWKCIVGNSKKWKEGAIELDVAMPGSNTTLRATRLGIKDNTSEVLFEWNGGASFAEVIEHAGVTPIPPYLNRDSEEIDTLRYQTVYSKHDGSVAAPTAGLHFTDDILDRLKAEGHTLTNVTLHVGAGTFKPIQTADVTDHVMHNEQIVVSRQSIEAIAGCTNAITAVGTTSVRTIETLYWLGVKALSGTLTPETMHIDQWEPYQMPQDFTRQQAYKALADFMKQNNIDELHADTQIIIVPGYKLRVIDYLITNFHQPHSTLLLLVAAVVGTENWTRIYDYALANGFRFLSYGDSSLLKVMK